MPTSLSCSAWLSFCLVISLGQEMSEKTTLPAKAIQSTAMTENQLITVLENSLYPGASAQSIALVINYCRAAGLDPMQKPVHIVPIWDGKTQRMRDVIMPGVGLYRTQAARTQQLAGISEPEFGPEVTENIGGITITYPAWCRVTVKRAMHNGAVAEFTAIERWKENYAIKGGKEKSIAPNAMWTKRPYAQLAKCAQAQALRMAFPEMTGSQPTADEMEGKAMDDFVGTTIDGASVEAMKIEQYPEADFVKNLPVWRQVIASGKKTADQIIAMVSSKGVLSEEQKQAIRAPAPEPDLFEQIKGQIENAASQDDLDVAADLIGEVADHAQREELTEMYQKRTDELMNG